MAIKRYLAGTTIRLKNTIKNAAGVLTDPSTSIKVALYDQDGNIVLSATDMVKESTGVYYYDWQSLSNSAVGFYKQRCTSVDSTKTSIEEDAQAFELYA